MHKSSLIVSFVSWGMHLLRDDVYWQTKWFSLSFWMRWLLVGDNICYPFWYLTAYLHVLIFLLLASKYRMVNCLYIFIPFLCMIGVAMNRYLFVFTDIVMDTIISRNSIFCGLPCVLMGMWVRKNSHKIY